MATQGNIAPPALSGYGVGNVEVRYSPMVSIDDGAATNDVGSPPLCSWSGKGVFHFLIPAAAAIKKFQDITVCKRKT